MSTKESRTAWSARRKASRNSRKAIANCIGMPGIAYEMFALFEDGEGRPLCSDGLESMNFQLASALTPDSAITCKKPK